MFDGKKLKNAAAAALFVAGYYALLSALGIGCPIKYFTGVSCAGCGMTRAWLCALRLDFAKAWDFHPLFWSVPLLGAAILCRGRMNKYVYKTVMTAGAVMFAAVYIARMLDTADAVVTFNIKNGAVFRAIKFIGDCRN